ncbi:MAG TPA: hypothetical protein PKA27_02875 [Fimbriimonadaceae bacterium]|nr:hypothetical protein [Fimbriimonadaceae bacterium]
MSIDAEALKRAFPTHTEDELVEFRLDEQLEKYIGEVVLREFRGVSVSERQKRIWDRLREDFNSDSQMVSIVFAFSPEEWQDMKDEVA